MSNRCKLSIRIETSSAEEQVTIGNALHEQLRGNPDYVNSNIVLNIDTANVVTLYVFEECTEVPTFII